MGNEWERDYYLTPVRQGAEPISEAIREQYRRAEEYRRAAFQQQALINAYQNRLYDLYTSGAASGRWSARHSNLVAPPRPEPEEETLIEQEENW